MQTGSSLYKHLCLPKKLTLPHLYLSKNFQNSFMLVLAWKVWKAFVNSQAFTGATDSVRELERTYYQTAAALRWFIAVNSAILNAQHTIYPSYTVPFPSHSLSVTLPSSQSFSFPTSTPTPSFHLISLTFAPHLPAAGWNGFDCSCRHYAC